MDPRTVTALADGLASHVPLSKARSETLSLLSLGILSARATNLSHLACERAGPVRTASTYRRLQRFFQHTHLDADWAAPLIARLAGIAGPRTLILDRTNWKLGRREINLLVLAVVTRRHRLALMWTVLDRAGNSGASERIALMERYVAAFGKESIKLLLADREFIGAEWIRYLIDTDIPFAIRLREGRRAEIEDGPAGPLGRLLARPGGPRRATVTLSNRAGLGGAPGPTLTVTARRPRGAKPVIVASNRPRLNPLAAYRRRWAIECLFADAKSRGLNVEDTRLTCPRKLALLTAITAPGSSPGQALRSPGPAAPPPISSALAPHRESHTATSRNHAFASASSTSEISSGPTRSSPSTSGRLSLINPKQ